MMSSLLPKAAALAEEEAYRLGPWVCKPRLRDEGIL